MISSPDTSFLVSLYVWRPTTEQARVTVKAMAGPLVVTSLLRYEFENTLRLLAFREARERGSGLPLDRVLAVLASFELDLELGYLTLVSIDLGAVMKLAARLSETHTPRYGYRSFDIMHVAAAKYLSATRFLTFDEAQRELAAAEGMAVAF